MQEDVLILGLVEQSDMQSVKIDVSVGEHHAFGIGAGPACVEKLAERILVKRGNFRAVGRGGGQELFVVLSTKPLSLRSRIEQVEGADAGQFRTKRIYKTNEVLSQKQLGSARIVPDVGKLMRLKTVVERQQNGAGIEDSKVGLEQPMTIHAEKSDSISRLHSCRAQRAAQPGRAISELGVGKSLVLANHCRLVWKLLFRIAEKAGGGGGEGDYGGSTTTRVAP